MSETPNAYARAGVDVDTEAKASRIMYEASKKTFENRTGRIGEIIFPFDDFAGLKCINVGNLPEGSCMGQGFDGCGTKVELPQRLKRYDTIAHDLFAMKCDDAVVRGAEPVLVGSVLDITSLGDDDRYLPIIQELADGYVAAAKEANVAVINGEIAQMGAMVAGYGDFPFNWSGACVWFGRRDRLFSGKEIQPGDSVVMLREEGMRANGLSLVRKVCRVAYGDEWHDQAFGDSTLGAAVMHPSRIYSRLLVHLNGGFEGKPTALVHGVAHITGGGIPEKLGRVLRPSGLGAKLKSLWAPAEIMLHSQEIGDIDDETAYKTWNMGNGMAIITPEPELVIHEAETLGFDSLNAGTIVREKGISLRSHGFQSPGILLTF